MFGMGFMEILLIAVIAIIALGPEKLPTAMVDIAKFFKKIKSGLDDAKSTIDNELNISEMRAEANKFKAQIEDTTSSMNINSLSGILDDEDDLSSNTIKKEKKAVKTEKIETSKKVENEVVTNTNSTAANKFKVNTSGDNN
ncbi:MAG: Sec-independent protein translocase subunit TatB [Campylobacteraceae bacterium]|nr:Sec-independent protein translocase subunit TatB [Campylobacteraceae bacterium]